MAGDTPGPETLLTKEMLGKIKECIFKRKNLKETADICEIPVNTFYDWTSNNYLNLANKIENWKIERRRWKSNENIDDFLDMETGGDPKKMKIKADISKFVAETLDSINYSKRQHNETSGSIEIKIAKEISEKNEINTGTGSDSERQP